MRFFGSQRVVTRERAGTDTGLEVVSSSESGLEPGVVTRGRSGTHTGGGVGPSPGVVTRERSVTDNGTSL